MNYQNDILKQFMEIIPIQAVSGQEAFFISYLKSFLDKLKIDYEEDDAYKAFNGNSGNLICRIDNPKSSRCFLLAAHVDTISPSTLHPEIVDGKIVSKDDCILGADDRAGVAILLEVIKAISRGEIEYPNLEILFLVAEELGCLGSRYLDYSRINSTCGFNFDCSAPLGHVIISSPGAVNFEINFIGKRAHSAVNPEEGIHAINMAAEAIANLRIPSKDENLVFNIGKIYGGLKTNIVPDKVTVTGEIRSFDESIIEKQLKQIQTDISPIVRKYGGKYSLSTQQRYKAFHLSNQTCSSKICQNAIEKTGLKFIPSSYHAGSDANSFNNQGIETANLGLGYARNHSSEEFIEVQTLKKSAEVGLRLVEEASRFRD